MIADPVEDHLKSDKVVSTAKNNNIRAAFARFNIFLMHGLHCRKVLFSNRFQRSAPALYVTENTADDSFIRVSIDKKLDVQQITDLFACEDQDSLYNDDLRWF